MEIKEVLKDVKKIKENPLCFRLNFNNYEKISSHYYNPKVLQLLKRLDTIKSSVTLGQISQEVKYSDGKWELHTTDYVPENFPKSVLLLQVLNLSEEGIKRTKYDKYIRKELHEKWRNSITKSKEIVMAITGTIGLSILIPENFPEANLNQALAKIVLKREFVKNKKEIKINPEFIVLYINSLYGRLQLNRLGGSRAGQSGLSTSEIKSISIPFPSYKEQNKIVETIKKIKKEAKDKLENYKESLWKIKNLLGDMIKLNKNYSNKFFITKEHEIEDRLDCYFYSPERKYICKRIEKLDAKDFDIISGEDLHIIKSINKKDREKLQTKVFKYVDIGNTDKFLGEIISFEEDILLNLPSRAKQLVKTSDLLQPRPTGSNEGLVIINKEYENQFFTTGFIQIRPKNEGETILLWNLLKSEIIQKQLFYLQSGSLQPEITPTNFKKYVKIPIPKKNKRKRLIKETIKNIKKAKKCREEYKDKLKEAKDKFLEMLNL